MPADHETEVAALQRRIAVAEAERDAWKGRGGEHYRMGTLLVEALRKQLLELLERGRTSSDQ